MTVTSHVTFDEQIVDHPNDIMKNVTLGEQISDQSNDIIKQ